jgi:hypothetical protein
MRLAAATVALVTLAGCASQTQGPKMLSVQVFEHRRLQQGRVVTVEGQHSFRIRVTNQSEEAVSIDSISLSSFSNEIQLQNADQIFQEILEPGQTNDFPMWVEIATVSMSHIYAIDSIDVAITCHTTAKGTFTETGSHSVGVE